MAPFPLAANTSATRPALAECDIYCRELTRREAGNFYFSFLTLPADRFRAMCALYAFMRVTDDLGDDERIPLGERAILLGRWRECLEHVLSGGEETHPVLIALADVVRHYRIPAEYLFAVIDGVQRDLSPVRIATFAELSDYCYHVAGAVGLCCIHIWGFHDQRAIPAAIDCGLALQLTNILRDLAEDADRGRVYLPREDLERFGYSLADLQAHRRDDRFRALMAFEAERARQHYARARALFEYLDPPGRPILDAMLRIYGGLLRQLERCGYDVFSRRVRLPRWRKLWIAATSVLRHRVFGRRSP